MNLCINPGGGLLSKERPTVLKRAQIGFYLSENKLKDLIQKKKKKSYRAFSERCCLLKWSVYRNLNNSSSISFFLLFNQLEWVVFTCPHEDNEGGWTAAAQNIQTGHFYLEPRKRQLVKRQCFFLVFLQKTSREETSRNCLVWPPPLPYRWAWVCFRGFF